MYEQVFVVALYEPPWAWHILLPLTRTLPVAQPTDVSAAASTIATTFLKHQ